MLIFSKAVYANSTTQRAPNEEFDIQNGANATYVTISEGIMKDQSNKADFNPQFIIEAASRLTLFKVGEALQTYYGPVIVVLGIHGNILSLVVMIQKHNHRILNRLVAAPLKHGTQS